MKLQMQSDYQKIGSSEGKKVGENQKTGRQEVRLGSHIDSSDSKNRCPQKDEAFLPYLGKVRMGSDFVRSPVTNLFPPITLLPSKKKSAFTLAEALITLGIIGVVAAMTIPVLIAKYQEQVLVNRAKKYYSVIINAINMYNSDIGVIGNDYTALMDASKDRLEIIKEFSKYFNGTKLCNVDGKQIYRFNYKIKNIKPTNNGYGKNGEYVTFSSGEASMILPDGAIIAIRRETTELGKCEYYFNAQIKDDNGNLIFNSDGSVKTERKKSGRCGRIWLDTNGEKGPNRVGSDFFDFLIFNNNIEFSDSTGNLKYILKNNKIQPYEDYTIGNDFKN